MKFSGSISKIIVLIIILNRLNIALAQDCEYSLNIYARTVFFKNYGGAAYRYVQGNYIYPNIKYIPFYGGISSKGGYDSVVVFYAAKIVYDKSLFDTSKYVINNRKNNKKYQVRAIIKDGCTSKEVWIMEDYSVMIDDISYDMTQGLINFLGKHIPFTLRDNWEIHYDYWYNEFYLGPYRSPIKIENIDE